MLLRDSFRRVVRTLISKVDGPSELIASLGPSLWSYLVIRNSCLVLFIFYQLVPPCFTWFLAFREFSLAVQLSGVVLRDFLSLAEWGLNTSRNVLLSSMAYTLFYVPHPFHDRSPVG